VAGHLGKVWQDKLRELFRVDNHRELFHVRTSEGALIEVALDHATVTCTSPVGKLAAGTMEFAELELKLKEGSEEALRHLAEMMQQRLNLLPARLSKFERSLRPLGLRPPKTLNAEVRRLEECAFLRELRKRPLRKKDPTVRLAYRCLLEQFEAMLSEEANAWEGLDVEGVHQMRVATRRIRAALRAFKSVLESDSRNDSSSKFVADAASVRQQIPVMVCTDAGSVAHERGNLELLNEFNREFKWLARVLGNVRDLDVYQDNLRRYADEIPVEEAPCLDDY